MMLLRRDDFVVHPGQREQRLSSEALSVLTSSIVARAQVVIKEFGLVHKGR